MAGHDVIAIGASAGGIEAMTALLAELPPDLPAVVLLVIHQYPRGPAILHKILGRRSKMRVVTAEHGTPLEHGTVFVAPPDRHLLVQSDRCVLSAAAPENRARPAVDPLFRSVAEGYGQAAIGVVLSGNLDDGAAGLAAIQRAGGLTVVQDPAEAAYPGMPLAALRRVPRSFRVTIARMATLLRDLVRAPVGAAANEGETVEMQDLETRRRPASVTCPTCHGAMVILGDHGVQSYLCHIGHRFSPESLLAEQIADSERTLEEALRALEETAATARELIALVGAADRAHLDEELEEAELRAETLRKLLGHS